MSTESFSNRIEEILTAKCSRIAPTAFKLEKDKYSADSINLVLKTTIKDLKEVKPSRYNKIRIDKNIDTAMKIWMDINPKTFFVFMFIIRDIGDSTNFIQITEKDFCEYAKCSKEEFKDIIKIVSYNTAYSQQENNLTLICPTTIKDIYIVNHNYIYQGNMPEFLALYDILYGKEIFVENGVVNLDRA